MTVNLEFVNRPLELFLAFPEETFNFDLTFNYAAAAMPPTYDGPVAVTPSEEAQVLLTAGMVVPENIEVKPIPSNYGRIGWNGAALTVS